MGRDSLVDTAKRVWEIMLFRAERFRVMVCSYSTRGRSGNSSGSVPMMLNSLMPHLMLTMLLLVTMLTTSSGSRRMISPKRWAPSTRLPCSVTSAGMVVRMPVERL